MKKIDLKKQFRIINKLCFRGRLKIIELGLYNKIWATRWAYYRSYTPGAYKLQGVFSGKHKKIMISKNFHSGIEKELNIMHTLGHEMLHYYDFLRGKERTHGGGFAKECKIVENKITKYYFAENHWKDYTKNLNQSTPLIKFLLKNKKYEQARDLKKKILEAKKTLKNYEKCFLK